MELKAASGASGDSKPMCGVGGVLQVVRRIIRPMVKDRTVLVGAGLLAALAMSNRSDDGNGGNGDNGGNGGNGGDGGGGGTQNQPPVADFEYTTEVERIDATSTAYDPDGHITSYSWTLLKGGEEWSFQAGATYGTNLLEGGPYTLELHVTDDNGAADTVSKSINVPTA